VGLASMARMKVLRAETVVSAPPMYIVPAVCLTWCSL
jgi:hypothetical protein